MTSVPFSIFSSRRKIANSRNSIPIRTMAESTGSSATTHRTSEFDKRVLVWNKKFPALKEVPSRVSQLTMEKARNMARIKLNVILTVVTAVACLGVIVSAKFASKSGDTMTKRNLEWHERCNTKDV